MSHPYPSARTRSILVLLAIALLLIVLPSHERAAQASPSDEFASAQPVRASAPNAACQLTWKVVPSPNIGELQSITAISANDVWVGGDYHAGAFLRWDGKSWNTVPSPSLYRVRGMDALSANDVWAVNDEAILHWDGAGWNIVNYDNPYSFDLDIEAISTNDVWTVGSNIAHWNGNKRDTFSIPISALLDVAAISANDVWAVGQGGIAHWDGTVWSIVATPIVPGVNYLRGVAAVSANDIWILNGPYILHGEPPLPDKPVLVLPRDGVTLSAQTALLQ